MPIKAETTFSLKDNLFNKETVAVLAAALKQAHPSFDDKKFKRATQKQFPNLELKERISCMVDLLTELLPTDFEAAVDILTRALPPKLDPTKTDDDFGSFIWTVPGDYVALHGCTKERLNTSLKFLKESTQRFTAETAIRPFLKEFNKPTMQFIHKCTTDKNYHVRRLASEGIRPFLPWAPRADVAVDDIIPVLTKLHADNTRYVTRSVSNTLNDISRINPDLVLKTLQAWHKADQQSPAELAWMTRHSLRTLLKDDHPGALAMQGYAKKPKFKISNFSHNKKVNVGDDFVWTCNFTSLSAQQLKLNLKIYFLKANGKLSPKVFAIKDGKFDKNQTIEISKKQAFRPMTTRVLYAGEHKAELLVNGVVAEHCTFVLNN